MGDRDPVLWYIGAGDKDVKGDRDPILWYIGAGDKDMKGGQGSRSMVYWVGR